MPSVNRRFAEIASPLALSSISIVVKPSRLSIGLFWLSGNPSITDWCTTLHFALQNIYHFVKAANSTKLQDYFQSQIIALLPRLTTLRIQVQLVAYFDAMYDQTLTALASLKHIEDISFTVHTDRTTYSIRVLRMFASSIRTLSIIGGDSDWFIGNGSLSGSHPFLDEIIRPWSFPNLRYLDLKNAHRAAEIYAQISFDMSLATLVLRFDTLLELPVVSSQQRVQRLVLWGFIAGISPRPHFEYGPSADSIDFMVHIRSTTDPPLTTTFGHLAEIFCSLSRETTRKVTWKLDSTPELRTQVKRELQEHSVVSIFQSLVAARQGEQPQWELEGP
jgi:hypothetical protein